MRHHRKEQRIQVNKAKVRRRAGKAVFLSEYGELESELSSFRALSATAG